MATGQVSARRAVNEYLDWDPLVREALEKGAAVVALESTVVAHGLPYPDNLETAREMREAVRSGGATPAIVGIVEGRIRIGLDDLQLERFATDPEVAKASSRDLPVLLSQAAWGATTVAGTVACAAIAGISVFATGGLGGVHRGVEHTFDISADLRELARSPVAVVCSGAKSILDLPKTTEVLETEGVPVIGYRTDRLPAFYSRDSGLELDARVDDVVGLAQLVSSMLRLDRGGLVIANPVREAAAIASHTLEGWVAAAHNEAERHHITGKALTPYLLERLRDLSDGKTLSANRALLVDNAELAGRVASAHATLVSQESPR